MKTILLSLLISLNAFSQTTENDYFKLSYYNNVLTVENKNNCIPEVRVNFQKGGIVKDTILIVENTVSFFLENATQIKIKSDGSCSSSGWLSLTANITLSLKDREKKKRIVPVGSVELYHFPNGNLIGIYPRNKLPKGIYVSDGVIIHVQ